ncbi:glycosyltransferase involved in cell wall biosynthesis [Sediminihabitans luteus]|uniref:Glycosyltransferase involved in cell wall biosynthesis n=1 Tax=Sediminihabitans luteus TaxID=1138585 RepID=A0A2M9CDZ3_9CELL|nr:glycosyltransferase [Sediminihabitans luteus]PJJ70154.1 glycosyltransferase involved in cell wall biosynthesis [Sediminihabitans luteus]GII97625.1 glycosyltransferase WbuB [Sediminihabitans luteus]
MRHARLASARLVLEFGLRTLAEDPFWLALQAARRAPLRTRLLLAGVLDHRPCPVALRALAAHLAGDDPRAATLAARAADRGPGVLRRTAAEVAAAAGRPATLLGPAAADDPATEAPRLRAQWSLGDVDAVRDARTLTRAGARVRARALEQVALLAPSPCPQPAPRPASVPGVVLHHLTASLPRTRNGYTVRSHAILRAQTAAGLDVAAVTRSAYPVTVGVPLAPARDTVDGIHYHRLLPRSLPADHRARAADAAEMLTDLAAGLGAEVVHSTTPWGTGTAARHAARTLGLRWVHEVRGLPEETWVASHPTAEARSAASRSARYHLVRDKETELAASADAVVTISGTLRDELVARGVDAARVVVVPNGVAEVAPDDVPTPRAARAALGLDPDRMLVGSVGSLVDYEGLETTLHAVAALRRSGLAVDALVVGDGVSRPALARLAARLGLDADAVLPGRVDARTARTALAALDVVALPRRDDEVTRRVTPLKPVEAMAAGRPVVLSDLPASVEVATGKGGARAGLLVPPGDVAAWAASLGAVLTDPTLAGSLVDAGLAVARTRTWAAAARTYQGVYGPGARTAARTGTVVP